MVSFTCKNCGDILEENVGQHVGECRGPFPLTCIDCNEDFYDDQYTSHTSCVSVARKRTQPRAQNTKAAAAPLAASYEPTETRTPSAAPAVVPSEPRTQSVTAAVGPFASWKKPTLSDWMSSVHSLSESPDLPPHHASLLAALAKCANVPQKLPAFQKFACSKWAEAEAREDVVSEVFGLLEAELAGIVPRRQAVWFGAVRAAARVQGLPREQARLLDVLGRTHNRGKVPHQHGADKFQGYVHSVWPEWRRHEAAVAAVFALIEAELLGTGQPQGDHASDHRVGQATADAAGESASCENDRRNGRDARNGKESDEEAGENDDVEENSIGGKKKKKHGKHKEEVGEGDGGGKKSKKNKHKRHVAEAGEEEDLPRKKSLRNV